MLDTIHDVNFDKLPRPRFAIPAIAGLAFVGFVNGGGLDVTDPPGGAYSEQTVWMLAVRDLRDKAAFDRLFDFYAPRLKRMVMRAGARGEQAEDIVQDVMLTVWRKAALFDPHRAQVSSWVYQIARNRQVDLVRKEQRPVPDDIYPNDQGTDDPDLILALGQETDRLRRALAGLSEDQRGMIERAYLGELTHSEIQTETGLPLGTIKSRIRLGLDRLRHELKGMRQ